VDEIAQFPLVHGGKGNLFRNYGMPGKGGDNIFDPATGKLEKFLDPGAEFLLLYQDAVHNYAPGNGNLGETAQDISLAQDISFGCFLNLYEFE
jgi:hypothetical protein